jgi:hypothetical protein
MTGQNILDDHIFDQGGFAHAGLSNYVHMPAAIVSSDTESHFPIPEISFCEQCYVIIIGHVCLFYYYYFSLNLSDW